MPERTRRFIWSLITEGGFRHSYPVEEALGNGSITESSLRTLVDRRLLRVDHQLGIEKVELAHDRLTDVVREDRDQERARRRTRRQRLTWIVTGGLVLSLLILVGVFLLLWRRADVATLEAENYLKTLEKKSAELERTAGKLREKTTDLERAIESERTATREATERAAEAGRSREATAHALGISALREGIRASGRKDRLAHFAQALRLMRGHHEALTATYSLLRNGPWTAPVMTVRRDVPPSAIAFDQNSVRVAIGWADGVLEVWTSASNRPALRRQVGKSPIRSIGLGTAAQLMVLGYADGVTRVLRDVSLEQAGEFPPPAKAAFPSKSNKLSWNTPAPVMSPDGTRVLIATPYEAYLWRIDPPERIARKCLSAEVSSIFASVPMVEELSSSGRAGSRCGTPGMATRSLT